MTEETDPTPDRDPIAESATRFISEAVVKGDALGRDRAVLLALACEHADAAIDRDPSLTPTQKVDMYSLARKVCSETITEFMNISQETYRRGEGFPDWKAGPAVPERADLEPGDHVDALPKMGLRETDRYRDVLWAMRAAVPPGRDEQSWIAAIDAELARVAAHEETIREQMGRGTTSQEERDHD